MCLLLLVQFTFQNAGDQVITYKIIILPIVLYGCEKWSLALRDENNYKFLKQSAEKYPDPRRM
jgi:hypothetical protein